MARTSITYKEAGVDSTPDTCKQFLETVPSIPRDPRDMDDVDTDCEDHIADECRYRVMTPHYASSLSQV